MTLQPALGLSPDAMNRTLCSHAVLCVNRAKLTPILFEALLFLNVNKTYWDVNLVSEAMRMVQSEKFRKRMADEDAFNDLERI